MSNQRLTADTKGERIDVFLARAKPQHSRSYWQKRCEQGDVRVNGAVIKASYILRLQDIVDISLPEPIDFSGRTLPVIYEDEDVIVIDKPAGILTHAKGSDSHEFTVADFVRQHTTDQVDTNRPGIVHRLDRGTSGLIIAAKHPGARRWLQGQFSKRKVQKTYLALVEGHLKEPQAILKLPIERNPKKPQTFRVGANGRQAETAYKVNRSYLASDLVELKPLTGRTHQLRVHMAYLGHPIVGDVFYSHAAQNLERLFLHAYQLELTLPSRQRKTFTLPLPPDLQQYLAKLQ